MRPLIAAIKLSLDGKFEGPLGFADWVESWSEDYGLSPDIDACVLGARMYPGYESYWTALRDAPTQPLPMTGKLPTPTEVAWGELTRSLPHYVLSQHPGEARWTNTQFLLDLDALAALKAQAGRSIYLMGGGGVIEAALAAGLIDELRVIVYPLIAGTGRRLFDQVLERRSLSLRTTQALSAGKVLLCYGIDSLQALPA